MIRNNIRIGVVFALLFLSNVEAQATYVAAFGDSITRGYPYYTDNAKGYLNGGYIPTLQSKLDADDWGQGSSVTVRNWGFPGELVFEGGRERFTSLVQDTVPDYILLMEGTNDLAAGIGSGAVGDKLDSMVVEALAAGQVPVIGTLLPRYDAKSWVNITGLNSRIKTITTNREIEIAHLYAEINWQPYLPDGLHPNTSGYVIMAEPWFRALQAATEPPIVTPMLHLLLLSD
jgi:lysophospholipase L1-like esterase